MAHLRGCIYTQIFVYDPIRRIRAGYASERGFMAHAGARIDMAQSTKLQCRGDDTLGERVSRFQDQHGFEHQSDAVKRLIEVGLREQRNPIVWRFKDRVVEWVNLLSIAAVMVFALGAGTNIFTFVAGIRAAILMLMLAAVLLAIFETARLIAGMNHVGVRVRDGLAAAATVVGGRE